MDRSPRSAAGLGSEIWPRLIVDPDPMKRAGQLLADELDDVIQTNGRVRLAIPGGSALGAAEVAARRLGDAWVRVLLTWVDERCVPVTHAESNRGAAMRFGLCSADAESRRGPDTSVVLPLHEDGENAEQAIARVERGLDRQFDGALDVLLLGMGADGHIASLFPSRPMPREGWVTFVADSPKPPAERITLTRTALRSAQAAILVATGEEKREAISRLVAGDAALPAHGLNRLRIVTDLEFEPHHDADSQDRANRRGEMNAG